MISTKMAFRALSMVLLLQTVLADPIDRIKSTEELQQQCANLIEIKGNYFILDETKTVYDTPADMHVDWKSGNLYYTVLSSKADMTLNVIDKETGLEKTVNVSNGQSTTIDTTNNIVYFATDNGVYKLKDNGTIELYAASGKDVMYLAVTKDGSVMYIATYPNNQVYKLTQAGKNEEIISAIPSGARLTVDFKGNIFYTADSENVAHVLKAEQSVPVKIEGVPNEKVLDFYVFGDDVYGMDQDSHLYKVDGDTASATDLGSFGEDYVNTFALDNFFNVYLGLDGAIKKFKHYHENPCNKA